MTERSVEPCVLFAQRCVAKLQESVVTYELVAKPPDSRQHLADLIFPVLATQINLSISGRNARHCQTDIADRGGHRSLSHEGPDESRRDHHEKGQKGDL